MLTSLYSELFLPGFVDVVFFQDLDGDPCLTQKHILGQVFIVPQINSTKVENVYKVEHYVNDMYGITNAIKVCVLPAQTRGQYGKWDKVNGTTQYCLPAIGAKNVKQ